MLDGDLSPSEVYRHLSVINLDGRRLALTAGASPPSHSAKSGTAAATATQPVTTRSTTQKTNQP
jgi:hypothetical protein